MSSKRRKLDSSTKPQLSAVSAFAARKAQAAAHSTGSPEKETRSSENHTKIVSQGVRNDFPSRSLTRGKSSQVGNDLPSISPGFIAEGSGFGEDIGNHVMSSDSREQSPEVISNRPSMVLSTFRPNEDNTKVLKSKTLVLKLAPGERLVILGQCNLEVAEGQITILGSVLKASKTKHQVYAAASHSLPVIRCPDGELNPAVLRLHQSDCGLRSLDSLSPLFGKLWNEDTRAFKSAHGRLSAKLGKSTFQIVHKSYLQPISSPPEWNKTLSKLSGTPGAGKRIMLCGPKSSGKSTFAKLLVNRLLSASQNDAQSSIPNSRKGPGVALLDLDPGQPEYSHPGQVSLVHIQEPNFGPSTTHPVPGIKSHLIRAHALGAISPSMDPSLYMSCALDLFAHYQNLSSLHFNCPLVINTPGWVLGTGLEILVDLIAKVHPSEVIYMSKEGPAEVVESLQDAAKTTPLITLPSQTSEFMTRTSAHLRTMQSMSYFHLDSTNKNELAWSSTPLTSVSPWEIKYSGENAGILGIMCYGEQPPLDLLAETINGSIVSIVVIEEPAAIPGYTLSQQEKDKKDDPETLHEFNAPLTLDPIKTPLIMPTPHEKLPYFNPLNAITLDPQFSHTIGTALIRGIDINRQRLQILTPISPEVLEELNDENKKIVLVSGKLDTPGWAYTEELMKRTWLEKEKRRKELHGDGDDEVEVEDDEDEDEDNEEEEGGDSTAEEESSTPNSTSNNTDMTFRHTPWVEKLTGSQGRGIGARVWRVRRDLGRMGDAN
ncbi:4f1aa163-41e5-4ec3-ae31-78b07613abcf [Sclerotinia trifoliorum]|uniref:Polynucleotide 5'-hydroxyl-kinase GRC3 n=1 Tax=Sclerotinia trifoliorum TaxID=28548 RepID=A0A8H2W420_9HELO|nr:4f1aa163-41e5-4ec3-ae31-78b07613abcf [Sclerotinia trifoliorum]